MGCLTAKASGTVASFINPTVTDIESARVYFSPTQLGSGTPSPDNVREIVGRTSVELKQCGKNLFDMSTAVDGYIHYNGHTILSPDAGNMTSDYIPVCEGDVLTYKSYPTTDGIGYWTGYCFYTSKDMSTYIDKRKVVEKTTICTITVPKGAKYLRIGSRYLKNGYTNPIKVQPSHFHGNVCPMNIKRWSILRAMVGSISTLTSKAKVVLNVPQRLCG